MDHGMGLNALQIPPKRLHLSQWAIDNQLWVTVVIHMLQLWFDDVPASIARVYLTPYQHYRWRP